MNTNNTLTPHLYDIEFMEVLADAVSVRIRKFDNFATVTLLLGRSTITLYTTDEVEAYSIVAKMAVPSFDNCLN